MPKSAIILKLLRPIWVGIRPFWVSAIKNLKTYLFTAKTQRTQRFNYSLPSFQSAGILGGSTAKNKKKYLCVLRVSAVTTI